MFNFSPYTAGNMLRVWLPSWEKREEINSNKKYPRYFRHIWEIFEKYLTNLWEIFGNVLIVLFPSWEGWEKNILECDSDLRLSFQKKALWKGHGNLEIKHLLMQFWFDWNFVQRSRRKVKPFSVQTVRCFKWGFVSSLHFMWQIWNILNHKSEIYLKVYSNIFLINVKKKNI